MVLGLPWRKARSTWGTGGGVEATGGGGGTGGERAAAARVRSNLHRVLGELALAPLRVHLGLHLPKLLRHLPLLLQQRRHARPWGDAIARRLR